MGVGIAAAEVQFEPLDSARKGCECGRILCDSSPFPWRERARAGSLGSRTFQVPTEPVLLIIPSRPPRSLATRNTAGTHRHHLAPPPDEGFAHGSESPDRLDPAALPQPTRLHPALLPLLDPAGNFRGPPIRWTFGDSHSMAGGGPLPTR